MEKQERKEKKLLTDNRMVTVNKRETSFEGLVSQMENGENGIYNIIANDKNIIFKPKVEKPTAEELAAIPCLRQLVDTIALWEAKLKSVTGKEAYIMKDALIEMRKDQDVILNAYRKPLIPTKLVKTSFPYKLEEHISLDEEGNISVKGVSLLRPDVVSLLLCNYTKLKQDAAGNFEGDMYYLMEDLDAIATEALKDYPLYERIVEYKIDGKQNLQIQEEIQKEFGIKHSVEYISSLWRNKIPKMIASAAEDQFLYWHYLNIEKGKYKRCSCCGQIKLAHNKYFSKNNTSKDGFYSRCKECRNKKKGA